MTEWNKGDVVASFSLTHISGDQNRNHLPVVSSPSLSLFSPFAIPDLQLSFTFVLFCSEGLSPVADDVTTKGRTIHVTIDQLFRLATIVRFCCYL